MIFYQQEHSLGEHYLYHQFDSNLNFPLHMHRSFELIYVEDGELTLQIGEHYLSVSAGHAALILPNQLHAYVTPDASYSYVCIFSVDYIYDFYHLINGKEADRPVFRLNDPSLIARLCNPIAGVFEEKSVLYAVVSRFMQECPICEKTAGEEPLLTRVIEYVQEHFTEQITLKTVSEHTGYQYNYLSTLLHNQLKLNFTELVNRHRVEFAAELLTSTDLTVTEISDRCGFNTIRSFNRNFFRLRRITPQQLRKDGAQPIKSGNFSDTPSATAP